MNSNIYNYGLPINLPKPTSSGKLLNDEHVRKRSKISYNEGLKPIQQVNCYPSNQFRTDENIYMQRNQSYHEYPLYGDGYYNPYLNHRNIDQDKLGVQNLIPYYQNLQSMTQRNNDKDITSELTQDRKIKSEKLRHKNTRSNINNNQKNNQILSSESSDEDEDELFYKDTKLSKNITIPGTSIKLCTENDIKKWRDDRKKMWLIKISNNKEKHRENLGINESELNQNPLIDAKKDRKFIQSIQAQITRYNSKPNLTIGIVKRCMAKENSKLLNFIKELGDSNILSYELTEEEKEKLFGGNDRNFNKKKSEFKSIKNRNQKKDSPIVHKET